MKLLTAIDENGKFTGVQYSELNQNILDHHRSYNQKLVWLGRTLKMDEEGNVTEKPTKSDLANEVVEVVDLEVEVQELRKKIDQAGRLADVLATKEVITKEERDSVLGVEEVTRE